MNQTLKKVNEEKVLFFDIEVVRRNKELDINSREFELFQKKTRNKDTDELLPNNEVLEEYRKRAALKMGYTKIVSIGVGFIKEGEVHIKALDGEEGDIIKQFCHIASSFDYVCGANILGYDLPMLSNNGFKYFDVTSLLPDRFISSGKKPWNLDRVLDLMDIFKGTHYSNSSLDEICYHFDLPSPKTELDGSKVSDEYWENGVEKISQYVKQDVFASVNVFKKMRFESAFENFLDKNEGNKELGIEKIHPLLRIYKATNIDEDTREEITAILSKKKIYKKDRAILEDILTTVYINNEMFKTDKEEVKESKRKEIKEILDGATITK